MFGDIFTEQLVKVEKTGKTTALKVGIVILAIIIGVLAFILGGSFIGPIIVVVVIFGAVYLFTSLNIEYEYIITNNELDIDKITNKERRKNAITIDLDNIELMAHKDDVIHKGKMERASKDLDYSRGNDGEDTYIILLNYEGKLTRVKISPNEEMIDSIFRQSPSKVFK